MGSRRGSDGSSKRRNRDWVKLVLIGLKVEIYMQHDWLIFCYQIWRWKERKKDDPRNTWSCLKNVAPTIFSTVFSEVSSLIGPLFCDLYHTTLADSWVSRTNSIPKRLSDKIIEEPRPLRTRDFFSLEPFLYFLRSTRSLTQSKSTTSSQQFDKIAVD